MDYMMPMTQVRDLLEARRAEVLKQMDPLRAAADGQRAKLAETEAKLRSLTKEIADIDKALQAIGRREKMEDTVTIKDAILQVLRQHPDGLTSQELLAEINRRFFRDTVVRTSMSPQLSRLLNKDKKIKIKGDRYFLA